MRHAYIVAASYVARGASVRMVRGLERATCSTIPVAYVKRVCKHMLRTIFKVATTWLKTVVSFYSFGWNCACAQTDFRPMMVIISLSNVYLMALSICRGRRCSNPASATRRHCLLLRTCGWMNHLVLMCLRHHRRPHSNEQVLGQVTVHIADIMYIGTIWTKQKRAIRQSSKKTEL